MKNYADLHPQSFNEIEEKYPKLWRMIGEFDIGQNLELEIANLIYSQKGSYKSVDYLAKVLGIRIRLYSQGVLLNNPDNDPSQTYKTPTNVDEIVIDELPAELYYRVSTTLNSVLRDLIWYLNKDITPGIVIVYADFEIHQWDSYNYRLVSINNIIISEVEDS